MSLFTLTFISLPLFVKVFSQLLNEKNDANSPLVDRGFGLICFEYFSSTNTPIYLHVREIALSKKQEREERIPAERKNDL